MKVVLDSNIIISRVLVPSGKPAQVVEQCRKREIEVLTSEAILREYGRVLRYKRVRARHHLSDNQIDEALDAIRVLGFVVEVGVKLEVVTADPDDNIIVECAVAGGADYIVSGDAHLLSLRQYQGIEILSPAAFLLLLNQE